MSARRVLQQHLSNGAKLFQDNVKVEATHTRNVKAHPFSSNEGARADKLMMPSNISWKVQSQSTQGRGCPQPLRRTVHTRGACVHISSFLRVHTHRKMGPAAGSGGLVRRLSQLAVRPFLCGGDGRLGRECCVGRHAAWHQTKRANHTVGEREHIGRPTAGHFSGESALPTHLQKLLQASQSPGRSSSTSAVASRTSPASAHAAQSPADGRILEDPGNLRMGPEFAGTYLNGEAAHAGQAASASHADQVVKSILFCRLYRSDLPLCSVHILCEPCLLNR